MPKCPSCNKFAGYDEPEPEVDVSIDPEGGIDGTVRIVNTSQCCGDELKEATFDIGPLVAEAPASLETHTGEGHELEIEAEDEQRTNRQEGTGRYAKSFYGFSCALVITCKCGKLEERIEITDDIQASWMDELT